MSNITCILNIMYCLTSSMTPLQQAAAYFGLATHRLRTTDLDDPVMQRPALIRELMIFFLSIHLFFLWCLGNYWCNLTCIHGPNMLWWHSPLWACLTYSGKSWDNIQMTRHFIHDSLFEVFFISWQCRLILLFSPFHLCFFLIRPDWILSKKNNYIQRAGCLQTDKSFPSQTRQYRITEIEERSYIFFSSWTCLQDNLGVSVYWDLGVSPSWPLQHAQSGGLLHFQHVSGDFALYAWGETQPPRLE